jgi:hypothetical protein
MVALIVGADRIGAFLPKFEKMGVSEVIHWSGRSQKVTGYDIPDRADMVILCTDFLHHTAAKVIKRKIKERGLPAVYCRRAWSEIEPAVSRILDSGEGICCGRCEKDCPRRKGLVH